MHPDWIVPKWPAPAGVRSVCTTRAGGRSQPPYDSLNLGDHVGDDPLAVGANRALLAQAIQARPVFLQQVHGSGVVVLDAHTPHGTQADACLTRRTRRGLHHHGGRLPAAAVHRYPRPLRRRGACRLARSGRAGGCGRAGGAGRGAGGRRRRCHGLARSLHRAAGLRGRARGQSRLRGARPAGRRLFRPAAAPGKWLADLPALARRRLAALGIRQVYGNDGSPSWCTVANRSRFFSHRRDRVSGRLAACIWLA